MAGAHHLAALVIALLACAAAADATFIWPMPAGVSSGNETLSLIPSTFVFNHKSKSAILAKAIERYAGLIFPHGSHVAASQAAPVLPHMDVQISSDDETLTLGTDESYTLLVLTDGSGALLRAPTVYGALRGLETFSQLVTFDFDAKAYLLHSAPWGVEDVPRFAHRGLLMDTSRHFQPVPELKILLDAMSYTKLNVLHWHIVDSQSFPMEVASYPKLWAGAYSADERYTQDDLADVVQYAKERGIRVVPEFDGPGHAASWCVGYPEACPSSTCLEPLNPATNFTFDLIESLLGEVTGRKAGGGLFPDALIHLGGDEVNTDCWTNTPAIASWMASNNLTADDMYFVKRVHEIALAQGRQPIAWEEVFNHFSTNLDKRSIIHIWLDQRNMAKVVANGYRSILSDTYWYLDHLDVTWSTLYTNDPHLGIDDPAEQALVLGAEVCMWGETVDASDLQATVWPRAAAGAERLWSPRTVSDASAAAERIAYFRCLLTRRGVGAAPLDNNAARAPPSGPGGCRSQ